MRSSLLAAAVAVSALSVASPARADEPPEGLAVAAGTATALVPFGIASLMMAHEGGTADPRAGVIVLSSGLALAPVVGHLIVREWGRAGLLGALGAAGAGGMIGLFEAEPRTFRRGDKVTRMVAGALLAYLLATSTFGILDCLYANERSPVSVVPAFDGRSASLSIAGAL